MFHGLLCIKQAPFFFQNEARLKETIGVGVGDIFRKLNFIHVINSVKQIVSLFFSFVFFLSIL